MSRQQVNVAIVGTGFIAETRARAYTGVSGPEPRLVAAVSRTPERLESYARRHGIPDVYTRLEPVLERRDVDVVDLCVPNHLHRPMTELAAAAGKHVICSKPLTAFDGAGLTDDVRVGDVPRDQMLREAESNASSMLEATRRAGVSLMYAEHAMGAMLYLKRQEGMRRSGRPIRPRAVVAEVADLTRTPGFEAEARHYVVTGWVDVENWGTAVVTFDDGTRATVFASDAVLGGMESTLQVLM